MAASLEVKNISKSFSGLRAVQNVSFTVPKGEIVGLIGPNGAGKTTCFNMIAGVYTPDEGTITLDGQNIGGWRPDQVCLAGVGRTFQIVKPFAGLTVLENVIVGALKASPSVVVAREKSAACSNALASGASAINPPPN
jgi:branched-chain amino acid transport system ATP-binding protein